MKMRRGTFGTSSETPPRSLKIVQRVLGDEENQAKLAEALQKLPDTLDNMNHTFQATDETLRKFTQRSPSDGKTPIERMVSTIEMTERTLRKFSEPPEPGKPAPADQIANAMDNIGEITSLMRSVIGRIDEGRRIAGGTVERPAVVRPAQPCGQEYWRRSARDSSRSSTTPASFTDKIARHPGVIVRDAVKPGPGIK